MSELPTSKYYIYDSLISESNFSQSWKARKISSGKNCFLKLPLNNTYKDLDTINSILKTAYDCQTQIYSDAILRPTARYKENGKIILEYDFIDQSVYIPLTVENFFGAFTQICLISDFLHLSGFTHRDLKLDNFKIKKNGDAFCAVLQDLETLTEVETPANANIIGTATFIAPEVFLNSTYTIQSDIYSLGRSLKVWLESQSDQIRKLPIDTKKKFEQLDNMIQEMTNKELELRPTFLLDSLLNKNLISESKYNSLNHELLIRRLKSYYKGLKLPAKPSLTYLKTHLEENLNIFGLQAEMVADLLTAFRSKPKDITASLPNILIESAINRREEFWYINMPDKLQIRIYQQLDNILKLNLFPANGEISINSVNIKKLIERAEIHNRDKNYLKSNLILKNLIEKAFPNKQPNTHIKSQILNILIQNSLYLGLFNEVTSYHNDLLSNCEEKSLEYFLTLHELIYHHITLSEIEKAKTLLESAFNQQLAELYPLVYHKLLRLKAWCLVTEGKTDDAISLLTSIVDYSITDKQYPLLVETYNYLGIAYWHKGDFENAYEYLQKSLSCSHKHRLQKLSISTLSNLAALCIEFSEYDKSLQYANMALKYVQASDDYFFTGYLNQRFVLINVRNGNYSDAKIHNHKYLSATINADDLDYIVGIYFYAEGYINLNSGKNDATLMSLQKALNLLKPLKRKRDIGKIYNEYAELALYKFDDVKFKKYLPLAQEVFGHNNDSVALLELDFLEILYRQIYEGYEVKDLIIFYHKLHEKRSYFAAITCMFYILVLSPGPSKELQIQIEKTLSTIKRSDKVPIFKAVSFLIDYFFSEDPEQNSNPQLLKNAYNTLFLANQLFPAMLIAQKIGDYYHSDETFRLAEKFYEQALNRAEKLNNRKFKTLLNEKLSVVKQSTSTISTLINVFYTLSELIKNLDDPESTLQSIIEFAVMGTCAERGVLLLRADGKSRFRIKSYYNCDSKSLKDIQDFSQTVPEYVLENLEVLVIDNAVSDKRTREFKSIVSLNILSILCLPIYRDKEAIGILYLDHHSIPTLFTLDDVKLVQSMGEAISSILKSSMELRTATITRDQLLDEPADSNPLNAFKTKNKVILSLLEKLPDIARTNASLIIYGESGTGKEIIANMIHKLSLRKQNPMVMLNCAAIPESMIEAELFGIEKNVATGVGPREGKFSAADSGTLFLDEIGDLSLTVQPKLLRVIESQKFEKVGSNRTIYVDIRFICATNKNLEELIKLQKFRPELYYRINTIILEIPPLRDRADDVPLLIEHFINLNCKAGRSRPVILPQTLELLCKYSWPGNVRELRNIIERICIMYPGEEIKIKNLPREIIENARPVSKEEAERQEKEIMRSLMIKHKGNKTKAATELSKPLATFCRKLKKYRLNNPDEYC